MSREGKEPIVKLLVTIMDRGKGERAVEFYRSRGLPYHFITLGFGTANSQILDYFGLSETEKDIVLTLVQEERALRLLQDTTAAFRAGGFCLPCPSAASAAECRRYWNIQQRKRRKPAWRRNRRQRERPRRERCLLIWC